MLTTQKQPYKVQKFMSSIFLFFFLSLFFFYFIYLI